jgi:hypothetical protein
VALVKLEHFCSSEKDASQRNYDITDFDVIAKGDEKSGSVSSLLVDDSTGKIQYFAIGKDGLLSSKTALLSRRTQSFVKRGFFFIQRQTYAVQGIRLDCLS